MSKLALALVLAVCACGGNEPMQTQPDAAPAPMCTKALYDVCMTNADCMSGNCRFYTMGNFYACTQPCTVGMDTTCPLDSAGQQPKCNNEGLCRPTVPNNCHL
jgi:hypothetical protein